MKTNLPKKFGHFTLLEKIGDGELAEVFLSQSTSFLSNKFLAIKRLKKEYVYDHELVALLESEAKTLALLNHPSLIQVYDFGKQDDDYFIVMEYVHSMNLHQIYRTLNEKNILIPIPVYCFIIKEVANVLHYLHERKNLSDRGKGLLHTDLGERNILISPLGFIKLIDFSVAQMKLNLSHSGNENSWCPLTEISPERARGEIFGVPSDIFQLGLILYRQLTNSSPFGNKKGFELLENIKHFEFSKKNIPQYIPDALQKILLKSLHPEVEKRYQSARDFEKEITQYLNIYYPDYGPLQFSNFMKLLVPMGASFMPKKTIKFSHHRCEFF